ncbi:alpha/beta fold hydrolase [Providencia alcalifaciens]|uniref:Serine hydrolase n=1 Tax=Providencia alcalifaciens DSM 30120 TaxID=520999 RepID=B6XFK8_9GAMM|nr:alpha/beta fold hydrolase [Providencia alcalifaciens]ATG16148.1 serine hydrolase family protein [Providencia alcalifaciens]EEB45767.1 hypothetical protein PROVALCAL_02140 [Providencia alcalifaciens DSM 30120]MTC28715.1 alpha/beta fold hydrolase [Providencia alcalifaciens]MTC51986.1 alpha/beta fold hydrolase [Providencia alcalifaciens]SPY65798.1 Putative hydrolase ydeN [Providencia alcalifaciens]
MEGKKVIVIHGYTASPDNHWFNWLKDELEALGATVDIPAMPESDSPDPQKWEQCLLDANIQFDENTILVGHSLGCITALRFLENHAPEGAKIGGYVLVSGFDRTLDTMPDLAAHTQFSLDYSKLIGMSDKRASIVSSNDWAVDSATSIELAKSLQTSITVVENAGHFLDREGFTRLPALLSLLKFWY